MNDCDLDRYLGEVCPRSKLTPEPVQISQGEGGLVSKLEQDCIISRCLREAIVDAKRIAAKNKADRIERVGIFTTCLRSKLHIQDKNLMLKTQQVLIDKFIWQDIGVLESRSTCHWRFRNIYPDVNYDKLVIWLRDAETGENEENFDNQVSLYEMQTSITYCESLVIHAKDINDESDKLMKEIEQFYLEGK